MAKLSGIGQPGAAPVPTGSDRHEAVSALALCDIFGTTVPLSAAKLTSLYPTHAAFVKKWDAAVAAEVKQGYLMAADAQAWTASPRSPA